MSVAILGVFVRRYRFPHTTYPYSSCICSFLQQHPYFLFIYIKCFSFLFQYFFVITFYVLNNFFTPIYKNTYGQLRASHGSHMKADVLYMKKHTQTYASYPAMNICHQLYERGVDLEVEGVRYIEMHRGPAAYVLTTGPASFKGRDLELESGVNACHFEYVYESRDSHVRGTE